LYSSDGSGNPDHKLIGQLQGPSIDTRDRAAVDLNAEDLAGNKPTVALYNPASIGTNFRADVGGDLKLDGQAYKTGEKAWHQVGAGGEPAFAGNWANFGVADYPVSFRLGIKNDVELTGLAKSTGALGAAPSTIFTLPVAYRPTLRAFFNVSYNNPDVAALVSCNTDGTVKLEHYVGTPTINDLPLTGLSFPLTII
jgi:hypothetical protein